jgi:DNA-binding CsgD family transcriptional regulator
VSSLATGAIGIAEAAYDLEAGAADWLQRVLDAGKQTFDLGLGAAAALMSGASPEGQPLVTQLIPGTARPGLIPAIIRAAQEMGPDMLQQTMDAVAGGVSVLSENRERRPVVYEAMTRNAGCEDFLQLWALDPDLHGVNIAIPSPKTIQLSKRAREHWTMLLIHLTAAHRLRRDLIEPAGAQGIALTDMPHNAEALLDPKSFRVSQAAGGAQAKGASETIRDAAVRVDRARSKLRQADPEQALEAWQGLVRGRWSLVDWFDTDGRRFVLAKPNAPNIGDPRGLTEREAQVATYAALGESGKIIGYRLGLSTSSVSTLLKSAMRKLSVKTQAQLVEKMRGLPPANAVSTWPRTDGPRNHRLISRGTIPVTLSPPPTTSSPLDTGAERSPLR